MWYDLPDRYSFQSAPDFGSQPQVMESRQQLTKWLKSLSEDVGVPLTHTVLGGFSQGGAMTLDVGSQLPLAGLMVLSGYLHAPLQAALPLPPLLMVHGRQDPVVTIVAAHQAREAVTQAGTDVDYHELDMGHEIRPEILSFMQSFIGRVVSSFQ